MIYFLQQLRDPNVKPLSTELLFKSKRKCLSNLDANYEGDGLFTFPESTSPPTHGFAYPREANFLAVCVDNMRLSAPSL